MACSKGKREAVMAADALLDLFRGALLPANRKLRFVQSGQRHRGQEICTPRLGFTADSHKLRVDFVISRKPGSMALSQDLSMFSTTRMQVLPPASADPPPSLGQAPGTVAF
jgi:hypothetical protein